MSETLQTFTNGPEGNREPNPVRHRRFLIPDVVKYDALGPISACWDTILPNRLTPEQANESWGHIVAARNISNEIDETPELEDIKSKASAAKDNLVIDNLGLVLKVTNRYEDGSDQMKDRGDIFQWGVIGLMKAVDKFDPSLGFDFSTIAVIKIESVITRELDRAYQSRLGSTDLSIRRAQSIRQAYGRAIHTNGDVVFENPEDAEADRLQKTVSIYAESNSNPEGESTVLADFIGENNVDSEIDEISSLELLRQAASQAGLTELEFNDFVKRSGIIDGTKCRFTDIGLETGRPNQTVIHSYKRAVKKLQNSSLIRETLVDF